eukprot:GHVN01067825.1.p2 GENE.GHVN01067825.1~~GHVN01067825.1.p2  ORF type:complete len:104 (-),score=14.20 GHVN01067825.1:399-710(-)
MPESSRQDRAVKRASDDALSPSHPGSFPPVPPASPHPVQMSQPTQPGYLSPLEKTAVLQFEESLTSSSEDKWKYEEWQRLTRRTYARMQSLRLMHADFVSHSG